ncbi:MAG: gluconokinase, partial [Thermodesulfobacteriota bacterium]
NSGIPLTDSDRLPWLYSIQDLIKQQNGNAVIACSALKKSYRDILGIPDKDLVFIYLKGDKEVLTKRLLGRKGHYAGANLLDSQLEALEEPEEALMFDIVTSAEDIVEGILKQIDL